MKDYIVRIIPEHVINEYMSENGCDFEEAYDDVKQIDLDELADIADIDWLDDDVDLAAQNDEVEYVFQDKFPEGVFTLNSDHSITYNGGIEQFLEKHLERIQLGVAYLAPSDMFKFLGAWGDVADMFVNPLRIDTKFNIEEYCSFGKSNELMAFLNDLNPGDKFYIGDVVAYHW